MPELIIADPITTPGGGDWKGKHGSWGAFIPGANNASDVPTIAVKHSTLMDPAKALTYIWSTSTSDVRGLTRPDNPTKRIASCLYSGHATTIPADKHKMFLEIPHATPARITFRLCDWDSNNRKQLIEVRKPGSTSTEKQATIGEFKVGIYLHFDVPRPGPTLFTFTRLLGANTIVNGIFLDPMPIPPDTISPIMVGPYIDETGKLLKIKFSEPVTGHTGFSLMGELPPPIEYLSGDGTDELVYSVVRQRPIWKGEVTIINYKDGDVKDQVGNPLAPTMQMIIENRSEVPGPTWKMLSMTPITFDDNLGIESGQYLRLKVWPETPPTEASK